MKARSAGAITKPAPISERDFQRQVVDLARLFGWDFIYHAQLAKWSEKGWPDLVMIRTRDRRLIFAELKAQKGLLTDRQIAVLEMLRAVEWAGVGHDGPPDIAVHVWRPNDLEHIAEVLR